MTPEIRELNDNILGQLTQLAKWSNLYSYLLECGYEEDGTASEDQSKNAMRDLDTYLMALYLCDRHCLAEEPFTLRSLAKAMDGRDSNSIKSQEKRLKLLFERLERFDIVNFYKDIHKGQRECWRIEAMPNLINFIQAEYLQ